MLQHMGAPCTPMVKVGDHVKVGQKIGESENNFSVPIHSSVSGTVTEIVDRMDVGGRLIKNIVIETDGEQEISSDVVPPVVSNKEDFIKAAYESGLAGLGGAGEVLGYCGYYIPSMTQGYGFDGIAIATMGQNNPIGTVVSAFLFGALRNGAAGMNQSTSIPGELIEVLEALIILFVSTPGIFKYIKKQMKARKAGK